MEIPFPWMWAYQVPTRRILPTAAPGAISRVGPWREAVSVKTSGQRACVVTPTGPRERGCPVRKAWWERGELLGRSACPRASLTEAQADPRTHRPGPGVGGPRMEWKPRAGRTQSVPGSLPPASEAPTPGSRDRVWDTGFQDRAGQGAPIRAGPAGKRLRNKLETHPSAARWGGEGRGSGS